MASPQVENGYLRIANEIVEALARIRLSGREMQIVWVILRKTWGWDKKEDAIPLSQFSKMTGIARSHCANILQALEQRKIIKRLELTATKNSNRVIRKYSFNKHYNEWVTVTKNGNVTKNGTITVTEFGKELLPETVHSTTTQSTAKRSTYNSLVPAFSPDGEEFKLSSLLLEKILERNPGHKKPNLQAWAKSIDLMIRVDKRTPAEIEKVIRWCQQDGFWAGNILSTAKLREKFDQLVMKMKSPPPKVKPSEVGFAEPSKFKKCKGGIMTKAEILEKTKGW